MGLQAQLKTSFRPVVSATMLAAVLAGCGTKAQECLVDIGPQISGIVFSLGRTTLAYYDKLGCSVLVVVPSSLERSIEDAKERSPYANEVSIPIGVRFRGQYVVRDEPKTDHYLGGPRRIFYVSEIESINPLVSQGAVERAWRLGFGSSQPPQMRVEGEGSGGP